MTDYASATAHHDDSALRHIFDSGLFWNEFSRHARTDSLRRRPGLFQNHYLTNPAGFREFARVTLERCRKIVAKVLGASTTEEYIPMARDLDRLSDLLCRVIDLSDFVRSTHPDPTIQGAATQAYALMFEYMNVLNTTTGLNEQLQKAAANPKVMAAWSEEEKTVAQILTKDFSKSAIDLPRDKRQRFVDLSNTISQLGPEFVDKMQPSTEFITFDSSRMKGFDPMILRRHTDHRGKVHLPTVGFVAATALRTVEDESIRREIYIASRTASKNQVHTLEMLLRYRAELANLSGYNSFAQMTLIDKMAKSPEAVNKFLEALSADNGGLMHQEMDEILKMKRADPAVSTSSRQINAWDKDYYRARLAAQARSTSRKPDFLSSYFSLGTVMQGLSRLFSRLYGVRFVPHDTLPGETWNPDVRRLDVIDENEGHIAVVYCDLFARLGKNPNPAHFTLRCSRLISPSEIEEASSSSALSHLTPSQAANDGMATSISPSGALYQLPTIALICDFAPPANPALPTHLTFREVQTLFHEMGHAIHSILGRTQLQNVSGTRCATDFAELPSVLMEHFAADPAVLALFAATPRPTPRCPTPWSPTGWPATAPAAPPKPRPRSCSPASIRPTTRSCRCGTASTAPLFFTTFRPAMAAYLFDRAIAGRVWKEVFGGGGAEARSRGRGGEVQE
ncbi:MAG: mitochondrial intermediate peptidase [Lasallia pustulata]|uniref:Mitochondrial intermediate peptidase n=1 Tax=Lasallia pustulata TaxID=136370 RepID=A0A5M8PXB7_9LECA|nr:MAG: mitochondrial intermediate peptidase [Lasallia pustulata]